MAESKFRVGSGFWTEDGEIVFGPYASGGVLQHVKAAGGVPQPVTALAQGELAHALPSLLPDGRHFLYLIGFGPARRGFYVGSLDARPDQQSRVQVAAAQLGATFVPARNPAGGDLFFVRDRHPDGATLRRQGAAPDWRRSRGNASVKQGAITNANIDLSMSCRCSPQD